MKSTVISISLPENMLKRIDAAAQSEFQTRSNFIRMCIAERFGVKSQYQLAVEPPIPKYRTAQEIWDSYDFQEEYEEAMKGLDGQDLT